MWQRHPSYGSWYAMTQRCTNPDNIGFKHYGGRGIQMGPEWSEFKNFVRDMGEKPRGRKWSLDRIDNELGYFKENCRWADQHTQTRNMRRNIYTAEGVATDVSRRLGGASNLVRERMKKLGWTESRAVAEPIHKKPRQRVTIEGVTDTPTGWARRLGVTQGAMSNWVVRVGAEAAVRRFLEKSHAVRQ